MESVTTTDFVSVKHQDDTKAVTPAFISNTATEHHLSCSQRFITKLQCG